MWSGRTVLKAARCSQMELSPGGSHPADCHLHTCGSLQQLEPWPTAQTYPVAIARSHGAPGGLSEVHHHALVTLSTLFSRYLLLSRNGDESLIRGTVSIAAIRQFFFQQFRLFFLEVCLNECVAAATLEEKMHEANAFPAVWTETPEHQKKKKKSVWEHSWPICCPVGLFILLKGEEAVQLFCGRRKMPLGSIIPAICKMVL